MTPLPLPHAPLGAHASFDFGPVGAPAGFRLPPGAAPEPPQAVYIGGRASAREPWSLLPFFTPTAAGPQPLPKGRYGRFLALAGDKWMIGPLVFKLCTPFPVAASENPEADAFRYAPVVCGYLEYDNSHSGDAAELIFGVGGDRGASEVAACAGFAFGGTHGFATAASAEVTTRRDAGLFGVEIGAAAALHFTVPAHERRIYPLVLGFFQSGFHYGEYFADLAAVLAHGLVAHAHYVALSDAHDVGFMRSPLAFDAKAQLALSVRQRLARTRRLAGEPAVDLAPLHALGVAGAG